MAVTWAYGDSRTYFRTQSDLNQMQSAAQYQQQMASAPSNLYLQGIPYQNALRIAAPKKEPSTTSKIIADRGFGGAESRPKSRRYAKTPTTASSQTPQ